MARDLRSDALPDRAEPRFSDREARQVLARAAEREQALGTSVSAAQLRDAALEAGISSTAFDDAVAEVGAQRADEKRRRRGLLASVIGLILVATVGLATWRGGADSVVASPTARAPSVVAEGRGAPAAGTDVGAGPMATACGVHGVPAERLRALASGLYPELLLPGNRHRGLTVALLFDAECHVKTHVLTRRGEDDGVDEVLRPLFPAASRAGWQASGGADVGPWTFEKGKPEIVWGMERARQ
jgi:hypothetical protein